MSFLRRNMLKKICKYQYGFTHTVRDMFIDLFNKIAFQGLTEKVLLMIDKQQLYKQNVDFFEQKFKPIVLSTKMTYLAKEVNILNKYKSENNAFLINCDSEGLIENIYCRSNKFITKYSLNEDKCDNYYDIYLDIIRFPLIELLFFHIDDFTDSICQFTENNKHFDKLFDMMVNINKYM